MGEIGGDCARTMLISHFPTRPSRDPVTFFQSFVEPAPGLKTNGGCTRPLREQDYLCILPSVFWNTRTKKEIEGRLEPGLC